MTRRSATALRLSKLVQAHDSAVSLRIFFTFSHDKTPNLMAFRGISF